MSCTRRGSSPTRSSPHRRRSSSAEPNGEELDDRPRDQYAGFADSYHWFLDDIEVLLGTRTPGVRLALSGLPRGSRVLDAACGIGIDVAALTRSGHVVAGSDASPSMVRIARRRTADLPGPPRIEVARWDALPAVFPGEEFDAVLCLGSSLAHAESDVDRRSALHAFHSMLVEGGLLVIDTRDWESLTDTVRSADPRPLVRDGRRVSRSYEWTRTPDDAHLTATLDFGDERRSFHVRQFPFARRQLRDDLAATGFREIALDRVPGDDRYTATARR